MTLRLFLPYVRLLSVDTVRRIVADTSAGSLGILPRRRDFVASLCPGILLYETDAGEVPVAVDAGVLVKTGADVVVSARRAIVGRDLDQLRGAVEHEFRELDQQEQQLRAVLNRLESGFLRQFMRYRHD